VIACALNQEFGLKNGWFVVRNRTASETLEGLSNFTRHEREKDFFNNAPWTQLPEDRRGTFALRQFLAKLLYQRIAATFPTLLSEVKRLRDEAKADLSKLGKGRTDTRAKRTYLSELAQKLRALAILCLDGRYGGACDDDMKLRTIIVEENESFVHEIRRSGHYLPFCDTHEGQENTEGTADSCARSENGLLPQAMDENRGADAWVSSSASAATTRPVKLAVRHVFLALTFNTL
jgi:hypothetical protein